MALSFSDFINAQYLATIPQPTISFASKTVIVTGASSGLGKEAVKKIAALGASKIILACRNIAKGEAVKLDIESAQKCAPDLFEVWKIDMADHKSVQDFAARAGKLPRLDVALLNAGVMVFSKAQFQTAEGTEMTMAVNTINTVLLGLLLLPKLQETANQFASTPHLTFVSSALYQKAKFPEQQEDIFAWLGKKDNINMQNQYNLSKFFLQVAIIKMASIVNPIAEGKDSSPNSIVINSLDPCACATHLGGDLGIALKIVAKLFAVLVCRTAEEGSRCLVIAASAGRDTHGGYMRIGAPKEYAPMMYTTEGLENSRYTWEQLEKKLGNIQPGVLDNLKV